MPSLRLGFERLRRDPAQAPPDSGLNLTVVSRTTSNTGNTGGITGAGAMRRFSWVTLTTFAVISAATVAQAQTLVADEIRTPYPPDDTVVIRRGPYATMPPRAVQGYAVQRYYGGYDEALPPFEVVRIIQSTGFEPLGPPVRRRWFYTISAISPDGEDGRVVVDARTGRIMRFVPAAVSSDDIATSYGPPGPPPLQKMNARTSLRPPMPVPHVASRTPSAGKPEPRTVGTAAPPPQQSATQQPASTQTKAAENKPPAVVKPEPPVVQLQPTRPMPAVQDLE
jgi:hypothetical protein